MASKEKKPLSKTAKQIIAFGVALAIVIASLIGALIYINKNSSEVASKLLVACMPQTITGKDNGKDVDFFVESNKDYNPETDEPLSAFKFYYYEGDERVDLVGGHYKSPTADMQVAIGFFFKAQEKINIVKNAIYVLLFLIFLACCAYGIFVWYKSWCKRQEKKKNFYLRDFHDKDKA